MVVKKRFVKQCNRTNKMSCILEQNIGSVTKIAFLKVVFKFIVNWLSHFELISKCHTTIKNV